MPAPRNVAKPHSRAHRGTVGAQNALVDLPADGCKLSVPPPPGGVKWGPDERARWVEAGRSSFQLWESPQATQWDETARGTVALLVTYEAALIAGKAAAWQGQEYRHAVNSLGLTPGAMAQLGWRIVE